eukprot:168707-Chlamydomonas_euryale.AAC.1
MEWRGCPLQRDWGHRRHTLVFTDPRLKPRSKPRSSFVPCVRRRACVADSEAASPSASQPLSLALRPPDWSRCVRPDRGLKPRAPGVRRTAPNVQYRRRKEALHINESRMACSWEPIPMIMRQTPYSPGRADRLGKTSVMGVSVPERSARAVAAAAATAAPASLFSVRWYC